MKSFKKTKIKNLGRIITGKTPPTKNSEFYGVTYPFITPTDITENRIYCTTKRFLSENGKDYQKNNLLPSNTICYTCIASIGKICIANRSSFTNQQINSIIVNNKHDYRFIYYLLKNETRRIIGQAGGVASPIINKSVFSNIEISVPEDKRIELKISNILWRGFSSNDSTQVFDFCFFKGFHFLS